jgi:cell fate regulator YaaT (PSP1 superfamily)
MAKVQDLPPNPLKISGACGRLMCCLKYEHPLYAEFAREAPAVG